MKSKNLKFVSTFIFLISISIIKAQEEKSLFGNKTNEISISEDKNQRISFKSWLFNTPCIIGFGGEIIHDHFSDKNFEKFLDYDYYPAKFTADKYLMQGWSIQGAFVSTSLKPHTFIGLDLGFKYDFNNLIGDTKFFDPYSILGVGWSKRSPERSNIEDRALTFNAGLGFNIWMFPNWGINAQGLAKLGNDSFLQASLGLVFKIGSDYNTKY